MKTHRPPSDFPTYITIAEASRYLGLSYQSAHKYVRDGRIDAILVGDRYWVSPTSVRALVKVQPHARRAA